MTKSALKEEISGKIASDDKLLQAHPELKEMLYKALIALDSWGEREQAALNSVGAKSGSEICKKRAGAGGADDVLRNSDFCRQLNAISAKIQSYYSSKAKGRRAWRTFLDSVISTLTLQTLTQRKRQAALAGLGVGVVGGLALAHRYMRNAAELADIPPYGAPLYAKGSQGFRAPILSRRSKGSPPPDSARELQARSEKNDTELKRGKSK